MLKHNGSKFPGDSRPVGRGGIQLQILGLSRQRQVSSEGTERHIMYQKGAGLR